MRMQGITLGQFEAATARASARYGDNVVVHPDAHMVNGRTTVGRVEVSDSRGPGARRSWSGRRGKWACWHAYRDVLRELFVINPNAVIVTTLARYEGSLGFETDYPATGNKNIGSMMAPAYMPELCDCEDFE